VIKKIIETNDAPKAIGTYSQGTIYNNLVFTSGQIPLDPQKGTLVEGGFRVEVEQVLNNLDGVLRAGNSSLDNILKLTVFITDITFFPDVNDVFKIFFKKNLPARSVVEVSSLPLDSRIEIEAVGYIK
jgi:2-iminobutanoate/2-iminopropanoate deaminase